MNRPQVLFVSWQGGIGHITRDLAVIAALRRIIPQIEVYWLSNQLSGKVLLGAGETILSESSRSADYNEILPEIASNYSLNVTEYMIASQKHWKNNVALLDEVLQKHRFDIIIGDEIYELADSLAMGRINLKSPLFMFEDFIGMLAMSDRRAEQIEDSFGSLPIGKRDFAKTYYHIIGYIIRFDPRSYQDSDSIKKRLGYGKAPLIVCATGGTAAGNELLELCGNAFLILKQLHQDLRMVCVCGESYGRSPPKLPSGVELHSHVEKLYEYYAACDLAIVVGGGTTTTELTALHRPFVFFPLEDQFDQQIYISRRLARYGAGIKMTYKNTSAETLAEVILKNMIGKATWQDIPTDGAENAARIISERLV